MKSEVNNETKGKRMLGHAGTFFHVHPEDIAGFLILVIAVVLVSMAVRKKKG